jgi:hypothetical protein
LLEEKVVVLAIDAAEARVEAIVYVGPGKHPDVCGKNSVDPLKIILGGQVPQVDAEHVAEG